MLATEACTLYGGPGFARGCLSTLRRHAMWPKYESARLQPDRPLSPRLVRWTRAVTLARGGGINDFDLR